MPDKRISQSTPPMAKHAVIIVAYHGDEWIQKCIESLVTHTQQALHIILVDNSGNNRLYQEPVLHHELVTIQTPKPMGFAEANNFALSYVPADSETICFLNQDTISTHGWFDRCLEALRHDATLGAVSPMLRSYDNQGWDMTFVDILHQQPNYDDAWLRADPHSAAFTETVHELPATAMLVKWPLLLKTGPFDPIFGSYYEDFDLCLRLRQCGATLAICPNAFVQHFSGSVSRSKEAQLRRSRWVLRNRVIYRLRQGGASRGWLFFRHVVYEFITQFIRACIGTKSSKPIRAIVGAFMDLIKMSPRMLSKERDQQAWNVFLKDTRWNQPNHGPHPAQPS